MPIIKSAKKRVRVARKATVRNVKTKRNLKVALKSFQSAMSSGGKKAKDTQSKVQSALDIAGKKGIMHKNKVARKHRQLAAQAKAAAGVTKPKGSKNPNAKKTTTKKSSASKKAAPKKIVAAKKPAAKKAPAKKPTAKKK